LNIILHETANYLHHNNNNITRFKTYDSGLWNAIYSSVYPLLITPDELQFYRLS